MKNTINYYYNLQINNIVKINDEYIFSIDNNKFRLIKYDRPIGDIDSLYKLNNQMIQRRCNVDQILPNKDGGPITIINNIPYVLLKISILKKNHIYLYDINDFHIKTYNLDFDKLLLRDNWIKLWSDKIDYYEYQISQFGKEYPILCNSLSYFIGLGENAISYLANNANDGDKVYVVSHKRVKIDNSNMDFYNPINFVVDCRVRDIAEYVKNAFFKNELDINELKRFLNSINLSNQEYVYFYSRLLFPTYYFDVYDEIINRKLDEKNILYILERIYNYERFLVEFYKFLVYEKKVQLEPIDWLINNYS